MEFVIIGIIGVVLGAVASRFILQGKIASAVERAQGAYKTERATLTTRLEERERGLTEIKDCLKQREQQISLCQDELSLLKQNLAAVETAREKERQSAVEKLALLDQAQDKLGSAFQAMSSEALKSNNQAFLELAKTSLERFQEGAKNDLEQRQKSIDDLLSPIEGATIPLIAVPADISSM